MGIVKLAIWVKIVVFVFSVVFNFLVEDYDSSVFLPGSHVPDTLVGRVFSGFAKWDGLFFLQIAHEGYLFEKNHAFFPGFPLVIRGIGTVLTHFLPFLSRDEVFLISGVIIAWTCSVISALLMEKLTDVLFKDGLFTRAVCFMFILTPANIFLSAVYSESLFSAFALAGIYAIYREGFQVAQGKVLLKTSVKSRYLASLFFALATGTRSNGTFLYIFQLAVSASRFFTSKSKFQLLQEFFTLLTTGLIHASPLFSVLIYGYMTYCYPESLSSSSPYCSSFFPNIYNFVQERYWNVGLFKYWELKQVPNFLLAFPMILLSFQGIRSYIRSNLVSFISLGSFHSGQKPGHHYLNVLVSPFILYWLANLIVLVFIANVQIITRALCSLPVLYWFICRKSAKDNLFVLGFFAGYFWVGIALFSNFYPWT